MPAGQLPIRHLLLSLAVVFFISACSSGSKESGDDVFGEAVIHGSGADAGGGAFDVAPPTATILFPPPSALTGADNVVVTGTAADASPIASIVVNGVRASSDDAFLTWRARVPLSAGANTLEVASTDRLGNRDANAATTVVINNPVFTSPLSIALDSTNNRLVLVDSSLRALVTADLVNGQRNIISGTNSSQGPALVEPVGVAVDTSANRAVVVDSTLAAVFSVNLATGERSIISNASSGTGPALAAPDQVAVDAGRNEALVTGRSPAAVYAVDLTTGNRRILTDTGSGPALRFPAAITVDAANDRALVVDLANNNQSTVVAIDLATGNRSVLSGAGQGSGQPLAVPSGITIDPATGQIIVSDTGVNALISINPGNGDRSVLSSASQGSGTPFSLPLALVADASSRSFVVDTNLSTVLEVNNGNGNRSPLSDAGIGSGPEFAAPFSSAINLTNNEVLVTDAGNGALYGVSISSGERRVISNATTGSGQAFSFPVSVSLQSGSSSAFVVDTNLPAIIAVDLSSGDRTIVSNASNGSGDLLVSPAGSALDAANNRLLVTNLDNFNDNDFVLSVDIATGNRAVISRGDITSVPAAAIGAGPPFQFPQSIAVDSANQIGYVVDTTQDALLSVNLGSGERSNGPIGSGTPFPLITQTLLPASTSQDVALTAGEVIVSDSSGRSVYGFNTTSGARRIISRDSTGNGTNLQSPVSIAVHPVTGVLYVVDGALFAVLAIEPVSGDRVVVSR